MKETKKEFLEKTANNIGGRGRRALSKIKSQIDSKNYSKLKNVVSTTSSFTLSTFNFTRKTVAKILHPERMVIVERTFVDSVEIEKKLDAIFTVINSR